MIDITQASDAEIDNTVDAFTAALESNRVEFEEVKLDRILLAVDASNQGGTAERFARALALRHHARVLLLYAYEGVRDAERERYLTERAQALTQAGVELEPVDAPVRSEQGLRSFEQILQTCEKGGCDLIVLPAPYLDDYEKLGQHSVGATLDVLICRSHTPLLVVRAPEAQPENTLRDALLPIVPCDTVTASAAAWMLHLVLANGSLELLAVASGEPRDTTAAAQDLANVGAAESPARVSPESAGLVAELQRRASRMDLRCRVSLVEGDRVEKTIQAASRCDRVLVLPVPAQTAARVFALAIVRCSRNPVLLVGERAALASS